MNRSIDSAGATFTAFGVHAFTKCSPVGFPFTASDPMEWVHCHIAQTAPRRPSVAVEECPSPQSSSDHHHEATRQNC